MGEAAPPPTPLLSFYAVQACFEEHRTINKNCLKQIVVIGLFKPFMQADRGATSAQPSCFIHLCKIASSIILPAKTDTIWTPSEPVLKRIYDEPEYLNEGACLRYKMKRKRHMRGCVEHI